MKLRDKYIKAVTMQNGEYIPFYFELTPPQVEKFESIYGNSDYADEFNFPVRILRLKYIGEDPKTKYARYLKKWSDNPNLKIGHFGNVTIKSQDSHFAHYEAIMGEFDRIENFIEYPYPDPIKDFDWIGFAQQVEKYHDKGLAVEGELDCTIFEISWYMRGMEETLTDMYLNEGLLTYHLDRITDIRCIQAKKIVESGVDVLKLGDDIATQLDMMMDPDMWRKFYKSRLAKVIKAAREVNPKIIIKYHTDGNPTKVIEELIEIGIDILNPIQPECIDPRYVKDAYGERLALDGTLGTQTVFPFGTAEEVRNQCISRIKECGYNGGLIIAPSHVIEPEVPWENIEAFVNTVNDYNEGKIKL